MAAPTLNAILRELKRRSDGPVARSDADLPPNSEAWDRLVKHVGKNATEGAALRRTA
jgi:hypothetical protein